MNTRLSSLSSSFLLVVFVVGFFVQPHVSFAAVPSLSGVGSLENLFTSTRTYNGGQVTPGASYTISNKYLSNSPTVIKALYTKNNGSQESVVLSDLPSSNNEWKTIVLTVTIPAEVKRMFITHSLAKSGKLFVRAIEIQKVSDGQTPTPIPAPAQTPTPTPLPTPTPTPIPSSSNPFSGGVITLSFDDGYTSQYQNALPILDNSGIKGTFYLMSNELLNPSPGSMKVDDAKDVARKGHEIGAHSLIHDDLTKLSEAEARRNLTESKSVLESQGLKIDTFAYPFGEDNAAIQQYAKEVGYRGARDASNNDNFAIKKDSNRFSLPAFSGDSSYGFEAYKARIDEARATNSWEIFTIHRVANDGGQWSITPELLAQIVSYIKGTNTKTVTVNEGLQLMGY